MPWEPLPLETDPDAVTARILAGLAARMPGWTAYEGAPEVALAEEVGRETALLAARFVEPRRPRRRRDRRHRVRATPDRRHPSDPARRRHRHRTR